MITFLEKLKKQKATDSVKRVGITSTVRYTKEKGLQCYIGPWGFYYPSQVIMQHILPMIFLFPAILVTLIGFLIQHDTGADDDIYSSNDSETNSNLDSKSNSNLNSRSVLGPSDVEVDSTSRRQTNQANSTVAPIMIGNDVSKTKSVLKNTKKKSSADKNLINSNNNNNNNDSNNNKENAIQITTKLNDNDSNVPELLRSNSNVNNKASSSLNQSNLILTTEKKEKKKQKKRYQPKGVKFYHNSILKWASTKTTGLGYNLGMKYKGIHDASIGSRIVFEIQSFYPFPKTMKKIGVSFASFPSFMSNYCRSIYLSSPNFSTSIPAVSAAASTLSTSTITSNTGVNPPSSISPLPLDTRPGPKSLSPSSDIPNYNPPSKNVQKNVTRFIPSRGNQNIQNSENHHQKNSNSDITTYREKPANFQTASFSRLENSRRTSTEILSTNNVDQKSKKKVSTTTSPAEIPTSLNEKKK